MRYRLRTLLILMAIGPPVLAWIHHKVDEYQRRQHVSLHLRQIGLGLQNYHGDSFIPQPGTFRVRTPPSNR